MAAPQACILCDSSRGLSEQPAQGAEGPGGAVLRGSAGQGGAVLRGSLGPPRLACPARIGHRSFQMFLVRSLRARPCYLFVTGLICDLVLPVPSTPIPACPFSFIWVSRLF